MPYPSSAASSPHKIRKTVGIDLGTTNSVIALLDATDTTLLTGVDERGRMTFPSVVGYHPEQSRLVAGRAAQALRALPDAATLPLSSVKRFMGLDRTFPVGPLTLQPPQASAHILHLLRDMLARTLNDARYLLDRAIITMPAYFNHNQIEATRQAGELAGYEVAELLHEPTAAAIYYSWVENHGDATYLVYDLGGGTFDVSIIRKRFQDYEVLSVSGDPFLGGDDFDRRLASSLLESATGWRDADGRQVVPAERVNLDMATPAGVVNFARLVHVAEGIKIDLTDQDAVERYVPGIVRDEQGTEISLETRVERAAFDRLIKDKVDRTIDCCREALARARERTGLRLSDIDYIVLVGGSSRVPLVRETVRAAFGNATLPEHVRNLDPLLHEPDLCVAYGAALRAATHGTRYLFQTTGMGEVAAPDLELHVTSPANTRHIAYCLTGVVRAGRRSQTPPSAADLNLEGGSVRVRSLATGLTDEAFLDDHGTFAQELELQPETDNALECTLCDGGGLELARLVLGVRHQGGSRHLGQGVLPTQLITKPLQIEVLNRSRQRVKQVIAPVGATLPSVFNCTCRTQDQAGRVIVPIFEENRVIKQMVINDLDPTLAIGSLVEVELAIDVKHAITVQVRVRQGDLAGDRCETATIEAAPPPQRPTRKEIDDVQQQIDALLVQFSGSFRTRLRARAAQLREDLLEALRYEDEPKAIQRMAELRELLQNLEASQGQMLDPPWPRFAQLVQKCMDLSAHVADATGRKREELFEHIESQERYAEQAYEEHNQPLYRECRENLEKYAGYLEQLLRDTLPRPLVRPPQPPEAEAKSDVDRFRAYLASVWKQVRAAGRGDLEERLTEIAGRAKGLGQRVKTEPHNAMRDAHHLGTEVAKVEDQLKNKRRQAAGEDAGLLEGET
jgi:molecular chaperone DnaK